jgi:hypothetical protein
MVNEQDDELMQERLTSSNSKARLAPQIAPAEGESFDGVLQDMRLKWTRFQKMPGTNPIDAREQTTVSETPDVSGKSVVEPLEQISFQLTPRTPLPLTVPSAPHTPACLKPPDLASSTTLQSLEDQKASELEAVWREVNDGPEGTLNNRQTPRGLPALSSPRMASSTKPGTIQKNSVVPLPPLNSTSGSISKQLGNVGGAEFLATRPKKRQEECTQM